MAKNTKQKQTIINGYTDIIQNSTAMYFFSGSLNATMSSQIRNNIVGNAKLTLIKNTLFELACKKAGVKLEIKDYNNALIVQDNLIENAFNLNKFLTEKEFISNKIVIKKDVYEGSKLKQIASLGSESQVYGKLVSIMAMPATMLVRYLKSPVQKLVYVLSQIQK